MNRQFYARPYFGEPDTYRVCSKCGFGRTVEEYFRKGKVWKTCNEYSVKAAAYRKAQTAHATVASDHLDAINLRLAQLRISQQQQLAMLQHQDFERHHQQQVEQQWQEEQGDSRMTLNYILFDLEIYDPSPLELYEQHRRLNHQTQQLFSPKTLLPETVAEEPVSCQNPRLELYIEPFQTYSPNANQDIYGGSNQGMLPDYGVLNPNFYCNLDAAANAEQSYFRCDYSWIDPTLDLNCQFDPDWLSPEVQKIDFEQCLANALAADDLPKLPEAVLLNNEDGFDLTQFPEDHMDQGMERMDSMFLGHSNDSYMPSQSYAETPRSYLGGPDIMDVDMMGQDLWVPQDYASNTIAGVCQPLREAPAKCACKPRNKAATVNLDAYFADFNASNDILRQPTSPRRDLTGEPLAKHLISEIGLAVRLSELHHRWSKMRGIGIWFREVETLDRLEERKLITPWGSLSNWFAIYQGQLEDILDRYGEGSRLDWQTRRKFLAEKKVLMKSLKDDLGKEISRLYQDNMKALLQVLVELTGQNDVHPVKTALDKQLRAIKATVANDCQVNKVLYLDVHRQLGTFIQGSLGQ